MFDSITQDNRLAISRFYCFWFVRTVLKNVKKFSRIVCVSLFSYQGLLFFRTACSFYLIQSCLSRTFLIFFQSFQLLKKLKRRRRDLNPRAALTTYSLSRGAPSASLGTSPNCPRFVVSQKRLSSHSRVFI